MRTTTQDVAGAGSGTNAGMNAGAGSDAAARTRIADMAEIEDGLVQATLKGRQLLPRAANGQPIAPSDPAAASYRRELACGRFRPFKGRLTVLLCDIADGVPVDVAVAPERMLIAIAEQVAAQHERAERALARPIMSLVTTETRAQQRLDLAELRLAESPESADALRAVVEEADRYIGPLEVLRGACRQKLAVIRATTRRVVGRRRGPLALHS